MNLTQIKLLKLKNIISSIAKNFPDSFSRQEYCKIYSEKLNISELILLKEVNSARKQVDFNHKSIKMKQK